MRDHTNIQDNIDVRHKMCICCQNVDSFRILQTFDMDSNLIYPQESLVSDHILIFIVAQVGEIQSKLINTKLAQLLYLNSFSNLVCIGISVPQKTK